MKLEWLVHFSEDSNQIFGFLILWSSFNYICQTAYKNPFRLETNGPGEIATRAHPTNTTIFFPQYRLWTLYQVSESSEYNLYATGKMLFLLFCCSFIEVQGCMFT